MKTRVQPVKTTPKFAGLILLAMGLAVSGCAKKGAPEFVQDPETRAQLNVFATEKENQARALASADSQQLPTPFNAFFSAVESGDWDALTNHYSQMRASFKGDGRLYGAWWQPVLETFGAAEQFTLGDAKYAAAYGNDIIQSIPAGSIYFGGTDPGRFLVTAMQKSQINGEPFFTLSQNPLTDGSYLDYLRSIYGNKIYIPTAADLQKCFDDYYRDYQKRQATHQLMPGEDVTNGPDGKMQVNSYMSVIQIRGPLARMIFDQNTNQEFYVEESFPLEWMYPYLEPHGLIYRLNRQPLATLSEDTIQKDHDYWSKTISPMIGDWLNDDTSVKDVSAFVEKVFLNHDFNGFIGDTNFVRNSYANRMFSKERSSIAGLYAWRATHATDPSGKERMNRAADFAFRQAWALCPSSPEVVFRYVQLLMEEKRTADALTVAETAEKLAPGQDQAEQLNQLVEQLQRSQNQ
jgi:hypothetical protein